MKLQNKKAFTLVELIVVITILAILSTIGFVSYSSYLGGSRDTNRISQLKAISEWLYLYSTNHSLPSPDAKIDIKANWTVIAYQWYAWSNVLETITYSTEWMDPKDKTYYSYYLTRNKKKFQLMAFLEGEDKLQNKAIWIDYSNRFLTVFWDKLWIIVDENNTPIQDVASIILDSYLDIVTTNNLYNIHFSDISTLSWTWKTLKWAVWWRGLVWYWSFDEIIDNSFLDYSENSAIWTMSWWVSLWIWQSWNSAVFDWIDWEFYVDLIKNIWWNSSGPHTISAWIKPSNISSCEDNSCREWILLLWNYDIDYINETWPWTHHWLIWWRDWIWQFWIWNWSQKVPDLSIWTWQQVIMVFDWENMKWYLNWNLINDNSSEVKDTYMNIKDSHLFLWRKNIVGETYYEWEMDELRIYNRVLSWEEVRLLYNLDK